MTLEQLKVFVKVVQTGSFTRAAELLQSQKSHVSRVVSQLEAEMGVKLLERSTRSLSITEAGREIFERAVGILDAVDDTVRIAQNLRGEPRGRLRLTCGVEFGLLAVGGWIEQYLQRHPQVTVDAEYTSRVLDVVHEGFDVAIRLGKVEASRLVARHLGDIDYGVFACPRYLGRHGTPATPEALRGHPLVVFTGGTARRGWALTQPGSGETARVDATPRLAVNNSFAVRDALRAGLGVGMLPLLIAQEDVAAGRLQPLLPGWQPEPTPVHAVYPSSRYLSPKVRAFIDLALEHFPRSADQARAVVHEACELPARKRPAAPVAKRPQATRRAG